MKLRVILLGTELIHVSVCKCLIFDFFLLRLNTTNHYLWEFFLLGGTGLLNIQSRKYGTLPLCQSCGLAVRHSPMSCGMFCVYLSLHGAKLCSTCSLEEEHWIVPFSCLSQDQTLGLLLTLSSAHHFVFSPDHVEEEASYPAPCLPSSGIFVPQVPRSTISKLSILSCSS